MAQTVQNRVTGEGAPWGATPSEVLQDNIKEWESVDVLPGRRGQASEINESQSIISHYMKNLGEVLMKEGDVIEGCQPRLDGNELSISAGRMFIAGKVRRIPGTTELLVLPGLSDTIDNVGIKYSITQVKETNDDDLLDPAEGWLNFSQPGAYRKKFNSEWTVNEDGALQIFSFRALEVLSKPIPPMTSNLMITLARRTYNESGHYLVKRITSAIGRDDGTYGFLKIPNLTAYVSGFEVVIYTGTEIKIPIARDTKAVISEGHTFDDAIDLYLLNATPVSTTGVLSGSVEVTRNIVRGPIVNTADLLPFNPVSAVVTVTQGMTTFVEGTDYIVVGDNIDWSPAGAEPAVGSTYNVVWQYTKILEKGVRTLTSVNDESIIKASGDNDNLTFGDGAEIVAIGDITDDLDADIAPYALDVDYQLRSTPTGAEVHWLTGNRPGTGNTFHVRYKHWTHTTEGDYVTRDSYSNSQHKSITIGLPLVGGGTIAVFGDPSTPVSIVVPRDLVDFRPTGEAPVDSTEFNLDYTFYLNKWYVTIINRNGRITLLSGESARANPNVPSVPENQLPLERIYAPADSSKFVVSEYNIVAVPMVRINGVIRQQLRDEYNIGQEDLDKEADVRQQATSKIGTFTDGFLGRTKMDIGAEGFDAAINPRPSTGGELILPRTYSFPEPNVNESSTTAQLWRSIASLPSTEYVPVRQLLRTGDKIVNEALAEKRPTATINLEPHEDLWTDYDINSEVLAVQDHTLFVTQETHTIENSDRSQVGGGIVTLPASEVNRVVQSIQASSEVTGRTSPAEFCRIRTIRVNGTGFANLDQIAIYFDGLALSCTAVFPSTPGDVPGTIKADTVGAWVADFTIPASIPAGAKIVSAIGESGQEAHGIYGAYGSNRTFNITTRIGLPLVQAQNIVVEHKLTPPSGGAGGSPVVMDTSYPIPTITPYVGNSFGPAESPGFDNDASVDTSDPDAGAVGVGVGDGDGDGGGTLLLTWLKNQGIPLLPGLMDDVLESRELFKKYHPKGKREVIRYLATTNKIIKKLDQSTPQVRAEAVAYLKDKLFEGLGPSFEPEEIHLFEQHFREAAIYMADRLDIRVPQTWRDVVCMPRVHWEQNLGQNFEELK